MSLKLTDKKIIIIDDQRPFQLMLKGILFSLGARSVVLASTGEAALNQCKDTQFDFFFIDYNLSSTGKNGRQILEEIKARQYEAPNSIFFIVTGESHRPMVLGAVENQPDDYLMKPFSQNVLHKRLQKAYAKKVFLQPVFNAIYENEIDKAITEAIQLLKQPSRYSNFCIQLLSELYRRVENYSESENLLMQVLTFKRVTWALVQLAKTYYLQKKYKEAIEIAEEVLTQQPLLTDAYDTIAKCQFELDQKPTALEVLKRAIELSPLSIERQLLTTEIARECGDFAQIKASNQSILAISRKSIHQSPNHLLNYIRSIIELIEASENKKAMNRNQQEFAIAIQRGKSEEAIDKEFNYDAFSKISNARVEAISGQLLLSKKNFYLLVKQLGGSLLSIPDYLKPDAFFLLIKIGDFEQAAELLEPISKIDNLDSYTLACIESHKAGSKDNRVSFNQYNEQGIKAFKTGAYKQAMDSFSMALSYAPMHSSAALNLIQAILKQLDSMEKEDFVLAELLHKTTRVVYGVELPEPLYSRLMNYPAKLESIHQNQFARLM